jgi:hypothetical protein
MTDIDAADDLDQPEGADVQRRLRALRVDAPDGAFLVALHGRLAAEADRRRSGRVARAARWLWERPRLVWPALGIACGVTVALLVLAGSRKVPLAPTEAGALALRQPAVVRLPADKVAVIHLTFTADVSMDEVDFSVSLPDGLCFWSDGARLADRIFSWRGRLAPGENAMPIAVRGDRPGRYRVRATARAGQHEVEHDVVLEVVEGA